MYKYARSRLGKRPLSVNGFQKAEDQWRNVNKFAFSVINVSQGKIVLSDQIQERREGGRAPFFLSLSFFPFFSTLQ